MKTASGSDDDCHSGSEGQAVKCVRKNKMRQKSENKKGKMRRGRQRGGVGGRWRGMREKEKQTGPKRVQNK